MANMPDGRPIDASPGGGGMTRTPFDVSGAHPVYDPTTGQYTWQFPDGSMRGSGGQPGGTVSTGDNGMGGTGFFGSAPLMRDPGSFAPYGQGAPEGGGGGGVPAAVKKLAKGIAPVAVPAGFGVLGRLMSGGGGIGGNAGMSPELQELLALAMRRMRDQEPLFQSINAQALGGLPTAYQKG